MTDIELDDLGKSRNHLHLLSDKLCAEELTDDEDNRFKSDDSAGSEIAPDDFGNLKPTAALSCR